MAYESVAAAIFVLLTSLSGCMTTKDGEALKQDIDRLKHSFKQDITQAREGQQQLKKVMEQATALLSRNSADVGAQVDRLQNKLAKASGRLEESEKAIKDLNQKVAALQEQLAKLGSAGSNTPEPPTNGGNTPGVDKDTLFKNATTAFNESKHDDARSQLKVFLSRFPGDPRAAQAQYLLGETFYAQQGFPAAIQQYRKVIEHYKKSPFVPEALYKTGMSFYQLKFCTDASAFFKALTKSYKRHKRTAEAKKLLRVLGKVKRNARFCSS
jgi:tol-pal system protein YbgF